MSFFDLNAFKDRDYVTLSGGEKQRVHFARVAAQLWQQEDGVTKYLLLDEPLTFLDVYYQFDFMDKLRELVDDRKWVVVGVVHDLNLAGKYADQISLMYGGRLIAQGERREVLTTENIKKAYGLTPDIIHEGDTVRLHF
ncbi:MAG: hypothetical protein J5I50_09960 [Chitinophagaceae bacterium]|nr:hypothetical protein [Chitinophagaceae bacterium]